MGQKMQRHLKENRLDARWRRILLEAKAFMPDDVRDAHVVNEGEDAQKGFKLQRISPERVLEREKEFCEDRKINDPEHGLYAVADGVSTGFGSVASEITARFAQARLGASLDKKLARLKSSPNVTEGMVNDLVAREIQRMVQDANQAVKRLAENKPEFKQASSTFAGVKTVQLPDGRMRGYFAKVGDSRMYLQRGERLQQLTSDDSFRQVKIETNLQTGDLTIDEAREIDQYMHFDDLNPLQKKLAQDRSSITEVVGVPGKADNLQYVPEQAELAFYDEESDEEWNDVRGSASDVRYIDLQPGDRLLLATDGLTDNVVDQQIANVLLRNQNDQFAERALQETGMKIARMETDRSHPDDTSAVVETIGEGRTEVFEKEREPESAYTPEQAAEWLEKRSQVDRQIMVMQREMQRQKNESVGTEVILQGDLAYTQLKQERARLDYWIARSELDRLVEDLPPRLETGTSVRLLENWEERPQPHQVIGYDEASQEYVIALPGKKERRINRFVLEMQQNDIKLRLDDVIAIPMQQADGSWEPEDGFQAVGFSEEGEVVLQKTTGDTLERHLLSQTEATQHLRERIAFGADLARNKELHLETFKHLEVEEKNLTETLEAWKRHQKRQQAETLAK